MLFQTKNVGHSKLWLMASRYKGRVIGFGANIISPKFHNACNRSFPHLGDISKLRIKVRMELRIRKERAPLKAGRIRLRGHIANANPPETKRESPINKTDTQGAYCPYSIGRKVSRLKSCPSHPLRFQEIENHQQHTARIIAFLENRFHAGIPFNPASHALAKPIMYTKPGKNTLGGIQPYPSSGGG